MNYRDIRSWPAIPAEWVERAEIETLYSFGHYDGVATGLIRWKGKLWWAERFAISDDRYWIIELDGAHGERLMERGKEWERLFSSAMSWMPDGSPAPRTEGLYCVDLPLKSGVFRSEGDGEYSRRLAFYSQWLQDNKLEEPAEEARVVGYFQGWSRYE